MGTLRQLQRLFLTVSAGMVLLCLVVSVRIGTVAVPSGPLLYVSLAVSAASIVVVPLVGRVTPLPARLAGEEARGRGQAAYRNARMRQLIAAEVPVLFAGAVSFVVGSALPLLVSGAVYLVLAAAFIVPRPSTVAAAQRVLDRDGATSELADSLR
jgi:hypothetical protein